MSKVNMLISVDEDTINECKVLFGQGYANNAEYAISQGMPIIDGDVEKAVEILRNYHNGYFGYTIDDVQKAHNLAITALVTSSTRPTGDCISREALKESFNENCAGDCACCIHHKWEENNIKDHCLLIDNAPTVEARPQGEWIKVKENRMSIDMSGEIVTQYKCSKCERVIATLPSKLAEYYPFCHCGADMRGAKE